MIRAAHPLPDFAISNPEAEIPPEAIEAVAAMLLDLVEGEDRAESEH